MRFLLLTIACLGVIHSQRKKFAVEANISSVDVIVQSTSRTVEDFSPDVETLQGNLVSTLQDTTSLKLKTTNISKEAVDKLNAILNEVIATANDIETLSGKSNKTCSQAAISAAYTLKTSTVNDTNSCVKTLTELNNLITNISGIETQLEEFRKNTTLSSLQRCVPTNNTSFNFFETVKIKQCLNTIVSDYKRFVYEKTTAVSNIQNYVSNLNGSGLSTINECIKKVVSSTKSSADNITNIMIKCSNIIPKFLANVTSNINTINSTAGVNADKQLTVILNFANNSLDTLTELIAVSKIKLASFKEYITDAIETLKPYTNENFINEEALKENIFSTVESQIAEKVKSIFDKEASLYKEAAELYNNLKDLTSAALPENLQNCLLPEGKSSTATVDCLSRISSTYTEGIKSLEQATLQLTSKFNTAKQDLADVIRFATKKVEKLAVTAKDTAEFLYDKSGLEIIVLVKDKMQELLSSDKNKVHLTIGERFDALINEYSKIEAFIGKVKASVPEKVKVTGQPIRQAIELLAIVDPTKDYGLLYNQSLVVSTEAEAKIFSAIDEYLTNEAENLFVQIGELNDNYNVRKRVDNSSGFACMNKEDVFFTCVIQCLRNISSSSGEYFQSVIQKLDTFLAKAVDLPGSANVTITLAIQQIIQSSINDSNKLAGKAFRASNMTVEEFFMFVSREIKLFNKTLMPQLLEIGDSILDNSAKVYDKQFATLQKVRPNINNITQKVNIAIDDIIFIYPSAPINNKTIIAMSNAAFERIYKTFSAVVLPATNLTEVAKMLKEGAGQIFVSVSDAVLKAKCKDIYPVLEDSIACLSKMVNNMAEEINKLTQTLYAVNEDAVTVRNDARETLNENITLELNKLDSDSVDMSKSYYLHYGVTNESVYVKAIQNVQKLTAQNIRALDYNLNFLQAFVTQMQGKEDKAKYEVNRLIQSSLGFLSNALSAVRYLGGNVKAITNQPEILSNLTANSTKIIEPYMPKYKTEATYYTELLKNLSAENVSLNYYGSPENFNKSCQGDVVYTRCVREISNNFVNRMTVFFRITTQLQVNGSALLTATENALKDLLNGIVASVVSYNLEYSKQVAEDLYRDGNLTVESLFRSFLTSNNNTYQNIIPTIVKLGTTNKKLVENIVNLNFFLAYPVQSNIEQLVNSVTSAFKRAIAMSDGLTLDNEGAKAQQYGDDLIKKYKNFTESLRSKAIDLGDKSNTELSLALTYADTLTMKYLNDTCKPYISKFPRSDANMCANNERYMNEVNTKNRLNAITGYNNELTTLNSTALSQAQDYGAKLTEEFRSYTQPVLQKLSQLAYGF